MKVIKKNEELSGSNFDRFRTAMVEAVSYTHLTLPTILLV